MFYKKIVENKIIYLFISKFIRNYKFFVLFFVFVFLIIPSVFSQSDEEIKASLAKNFYYDNQIEKSIDLYEELIDKRFLNEYYYNLLEAYYQTNNNPKAEKLIKSIIKRFPDNPIFKADLGTHYLRIGDKTKAEKEFTKSIESLSLDRNIINNLANYFAQRNNNDNVVRTYKKGRELLKDNNIFTYELSFFYQRLGLYEELSSEYFALVESNPLMIHQVKIYLGNLIQQDDDNKLINHLRESILKKIQKNSNNAELTHLYFWLLLQEKNYILALIQAKSIDKRFENLSGKTVFELGNIALNEGNYKVSKQAFNYLLEKGKDHPYYIPSKIGLLNSFFRTYTENLIHNKEESVEIKSIYSQVIIELGHNLNTFDIQYQYAYLLAYYLNSPQEAVDILDDLIQMPNVNRLKVAEAKLLRADIFLMENDIWEATLIYSQVEKDFKSDIIGSEAKFKNAMLSYYNGDFEWAAYQFDVLRSSTSKLIANDAMKYSILIGDNIDEDSTYNGLYYYSKSEFLLMQNNYSKALEYLDTLNQNYLYHPLFDEVLYKRAKISIAQKDYLKADSLLNQILLKYPDDLIADDALNLLAELSLNYFNDIEKSRYYYERIILEYPSSLYVTEARKKYKFLLDL